MSTNDPLPRREFLIRTAALGAVTALAPSLAAADAPGERPYKIIGFTKPFRTLNAAQTANLVAEIGWDGVELPVRASAGQIMPEKAADHLPQFAEAFKARGREISIVTSDITGVTPVAEKVLRTMQRLGIRRYRLGYFNYTKDKPLPAQLDEIALRLRDLAALNKELGLQAGLQNHSGINYVGAALWDAWTMFRNLAPQQMGYCYDIGHATIEGGLNWPTNFRLVEPWLTAVFVKDFRWEKTPKGWKTDWCPLGEGMVDRKFFQMLKATKYSGPICQHHEYDLGDDAAALAHYRKDLATLREWINAA